MKRLIGVMAWLASACGTGTSSLAMGQQQQLAAIRTHSGPVVGERVHGLVAFRGIPYAAPPVDELRWQPPRAPAAWTKPLHATKFHDRCPQNADLGVFASAGGQEDCLYLNVFAPEASVEQKQKLPVLFWIHGGGLSVGSGSDYDASKLALRGNAVVVTINYRLGVLGFISTPGLNRGQHEFGNYGLMDQRFALEWVQRNIATFGGDPRNVTIFGESSGGYSVFAHIVSPGSSGKFQHAIAMSGGGMALRWPYLGAPIPLDEAGKLGADFAKAVGCDPDDAACLRKVPVATILEKQGPYHVVTPIVDGQVIPMQPAEAFRSGALNRVTLINGNTLDEGTFFAALTETAAGLILDQNSYAAALENVFGKELTPKVLKEYPASAYLNPSEAYAAAVTAGAFACSAQAINRWVADKMPTYAFEFAERTAPSYFGPTTFMLGASHTFDIPYLFPGFHGGSSVSVKLNSLQEKLSDQMVTYWAQASSAGQREAEWPRYDPARQNVLSLLLPAPRMTERRFAAIHHCDFWDSAGTY